MFLRNPLPTQPRPLACSSIYWNTNKFVLLNLEQTNRRNGMRTVTDGCVCFLSKVNICSIFVRRQRQNITYTRIGMNVHYSYLYISFVSRNQKQIRLYSFLKQRFGGNRLEIVREAEMRLNEGNSNQRGSLWSRATRTTVISIFWKYPCERNVDNNRKQRWICAGWGAIYNI